MYIQRKHVPVVRIQIGAILARLQTVYPCSHPVGIFPERWSNNQCHYGTCPLSYVSFTVGEIKFNKMYFWWDTRSASARDIGLPAQAGNSQHKEWTLNSLCHAHPQSNYKVAPNASWAETNRNPHTLGPTTRRMAGEEETIDSGRVKSGIESWKLKL